ncbi:MAG TPA: dihydropteroate synthase [Parachlamydiaceae bacterium]|nr:dihydropteroate synthase [Parachlamydiaceae bacterium]
MKKTQLMGILNVTPDSFYESFTDINEAVLRGIQIYEEGADILDVGGESTRPGAEEVSEAEELKRVIPVILKLKEKIKIPISIDTMKPKVALEAIKAGASYINDVSGFSNPLMAELAASSGQKMIVMHMQGTPKTMQNKPKYQNGILDELLNFFEERIKFLIGKGVKKEQIILDPGIGFGKSIADNLKIIHNLAVIKAVGFPLLLGISRKSFMGKILEKPKELLLPATISLNSIALLSGIDIVRVHDIKEHRMAIDLVDFYKKQK